MSSVFGLLVVIVAAIVVAGAVKEIETNPSNQLNFSGYNPTKDWVSEPLEFDIISFEIEKTFSKLNSSILRLQELLELV